MDRSLDSIVAELLRRLSRKNSKVGILLTILLIGLITPQEFLVHEAKASADTFGYTTIGTDNRALFENIIVGSVFTLTEHGVFAYNMSAALAWVTQPWTGNVTLGIYKHSDRSLVAQTEIRELTLTATYTWYVFVFASPISLTYNVDYILVAWAESDGTGGKIGLALDDAATNPEHWIESVWDETLPDPMPNPNHENEIASIYCTIDRATTVSDNLRYQNDDWRYISYPWTDHIFEAQGRVWVWYTNGTELGAPTYDYQWNISFSSSDDNGATWATPTSIGWTYLGYDCYVEYATFKVETNGTHVFLAHNSLPTYHMGLLNGTDGTITWLITNQPASWSASGTKLVLNSTGYPQIVAVKASDTKIYHIAAADINGSTWETPVVVRDAWALWGGFYSQLHSLSNGELQLVYHRGSYYNAYLYGIRFNTSALWEDEVTIVSDATNFWYWSTTIDSSCNVHLVYRKGESGNNYYHVIRSSTAWGRSLFAFSTHASITYPLVSLTCDPSTDNVNAYYVVPDDDPSAPESIKNQIFEAYYSASAWEGPTSVYTESVQNIVSPTVNSIKTISASGYSQISYIGGDDGTMPFLLRHIALSPPPAPSNTGPSIDSYSISDTDFPIGQVVSFWITVTDIDGIEDIASVTLSIFDWSDGPYDSLDRFDFLWDGSFSESWDWKSWATLKTADCLKTDVDSDTIQARFVFTIDDFPTDPAWMDFNIDVLDASDASSSVSLNNYFRIYFPGGSPGVPGDGGISPGSLPPSYGEWPPGTWPPGYIPPGALPPSMGGQYYLPLTIKAFTNPFKIPQGETRTIMMTVTWSGVNTLKIARLEFSGSQAGWPRVEDLPVIMMKDISGEEGQDTFPVIVSVPYNADLGEYTIPATVNAEASGGTLSTGSWLNFEVIEPPVGTIFPLLPDWMTLLLLLVVVVILVYAYMRD